MHEALIEQLYLSCTTLLARGYVHYWKRKKKK